MRSRALLVVPLALLAAACGSSSSSSSHSTPAATPTTSAQPGINRIATQRVPEGIGAVLVNGEGRTLYVYLPEKGGKVKCVGGCASLWPRLSLARGGKPAITSAVHPALIGTVANPSGGNIITYAGWPLHTYTADSTHGSYKGQGYGGQWYMISPSGTIITKPVSSASSGSTTSRSSSGNGGSGY
jgi:predicted lipoprotein with Yx(FWY)xxD motif